MTVPTTGPPTIAPTTSSDSSRPAVAGPRPCASTRYGKPHSRPSIAGANIVEKWTQKPSRVPGVRHAWLTWARTVRSDSVRSTGSGTAPIGLSRTRRISTTEYRAVARPATAKVVVQPALASTSESGTVDARLPRAPRAAVTDAITA